MIGDYTIVFVDGTLVDCGDAAVVVVVVVAGGDGDASFDFLFGAVDNASQG